MGSARRAVREPPLPERRGMGPRFREDKRWLEEGGEGSDVFQLGEVGGGADDVFGALAAQGFGGEESEFIFELLAASPSLEVASMVGG